MKTIEHIRKPVEAPLKHYETYIKEALHSDSPYVGSIIDYLFSNRGKGIRPLLVMLCAKLHAADRPIGERTYLAAMLIEMIHTASLVHDDVVDEAYVRRNKPTVNALWRSWTSVLIGDYILSRSFLRGLQSQHYDVITFITSSLSELCEGELIQSRQSDRLEMTREIYLDIVYKKTATLIGASSGSGALSAGASPEEVARMKQFGDCLGIAFQISDDILDYAPQSQTGKPACGDLRERKITLPLLTVLERAAPGRRRELLRKLSDVRRRPQNVDYLYDAVIAENGIGMASEAMQTYLADARSLLSGYPDSPVRESLLDLCGFVAERKK